MRTYVRLARVQINLTEHDPEKPWLVRGISHDTVKLENDASFFGWAAEHWRLRGGVSSSTRISSLRGCGESHG
jgi:hypothetical protein